MKRDRATRFGYVDGPFGQIHYAEAGSGPVLLCLHQTPRSGDEFAELMPLLSADRRVIAPDHPGMGASAPTPGEPTIEDYADAAVAVLDALGVEQASVLGHHTGGVVAVDVAARYPSRVERLILSSTAWVDDAARQRRHSRPPIDDVARAEDGSHLTTLWNRRRAFYPPDRPDVLERYIHDAIAARAAEEGHLAVARYEMERTIGRVVAPTLLIGAAADPYAFGDLEPLAGRLPGATISVIEGGTVGLMEDKAAAIAAAVLAFLRR